MWNLLDIPYGITGGVGPEAELYGYLMVVYFVSALLSTTFSVYAVAAYILEAVGLFTIAKRREISKPWMAWIPVANIWMLGSISDQYRYVAKGKICNRRKTMIGLYIAVMALLVALYIYYFIFIVAIIGAAIADSLEFANVIVPLLVLVVICLAMTVVAVIYSVQAYIAYYDLFASCRPNNAVAFLVLSIIFGFPLPFFVFACRKKDLGMPPRKDRIPEQPAEPEVQIIDALDEVTEEPAEE